jgi:hypothetical protein
VSRLRVAFFSVAALLSMAPWLRPPLSADIPGLHASLGLWKPIDSAGGLLLAVIALAALATLLKPSRFSPGAGVLLAAALAANAATLLNQPALIDRFHSEREQRQQIVRVLRYSPTTDPLSTPANGRVAPVDAASDDDRVWGDLVHAPDYLLFGPWLIAWAALGVWSGARRSSRALACSRVSCSVRHGFGPNTSGCLQTGTSCAAISMRPGAPCNPSSIGGRTFAPWNARGCSWASSITFSSALRLPPRCSSRRSWPRSRPWLPTQLLFRRTRS